MARGYRPLLVSLQSDIEKVDRLPSIQPKTQFLKLHKTNNLQEKEKRKRATKGKELLLDSFLVRTLILYNKIKYLFACPYLFTLATVAFK